MIRKSILSFLVAAALCAGGIAHAEDKKADDKKVIDLKSEIPADWVEKDLGDGANVKAPKDWKETAPKGNTKLSLTPPALGSAFAVITSNRAEGVTLDLLQPLLPEGMKAGGIKNFQLISNDRVKVPSGAELIRLVFDGEVSGFPFRFSTYVALGEKTQYTLTFNAFKDDHTKIAPDIEKIITSAKLP